MSETTSRSPIPRETKLQWWSQAGMVGAVVIAAGIAVETGQVASGNSVRVVASDLATHVEVSEAADARQNERIGNIEGDIKDVKRGVIGIQVEQGRQGQQLRDIKDALDRAIKDQRGNDGQN